ncbi:uncharacterized protein LOC114829731 [Tachysurus ichikawai]
MKGPALLDESEVSLFKTSEAIDESSTYSSTTINDVDVPYYKCLRGSNSLEGFHKSLPNMIPGPHCAARPFQVYLISGIARWKVDRSSDAVFGGKGRHHRVYSAPLIDRLNTRCQQLFGETVEENFRAPADVNSEDLLRLEYLFSQSTGVSGPLQDIVNDGPDGVLDVAPSRITLTAEDTSTVNPLAFEDACSPNPLSGFQKLETFCSLLVEICLAENKLSLTTEKSLKPGMQWRNMISSHRSLISCTGPTGVTPSTVGRNGMILLPRQSSRRSKYTRHQIQILTRHQFSAQKADTSW